MPASTHATCEFGAAAKRVAAPENNFELVDVICACTSAPMTSSQCAASAAAADCAAAAFAADADLPPNLLLPLCSGDLLALGIGFDGANAGGSATVLHTVAAVTNARFHNMRVRTAVARALSKHTLGAWNALLRQRAEINTNDMIDA